MKLPNGDRAIIPLKKLTGYCLNPDHPKGKHKARLFKAVLGITIDHVDYLYALVQRAAVEGDIVQQSTTNFGEEYKLDWLIPDTGGVELRTLWIVESESDTPRLVSAFIKS